MYRKCPKCGYEAAAVMERCGACGLIYAKYLKGRLAPVAARPLAQRADGEALDAGILSRVRAVLFHVPDEVPRLHVWARALLLAVVIYYGVRLARMDIPSWEMAGSLIHTPMVPIHEFGHLLFRPLGEFMMLLGGSLFQCLLPLIFGGIFLVKNRDPYAAALMLWWSAVAVMDVAPYMYDAQHPQHILLTGRTGENGAHDFIDVLGDLGLLSQAQQVGYVVHRCGVLMLAVSCVWAGWVVRLQYLRARSSSAS